MRISDACTLERSRLNGTKLFLYTQKTAAPCVGSRYPKHVVDALNESPSDDPSYFFWNGRCLSTSAVKIWETTFKTVFRRLTSRTDTYTAFATRSRFAFWRKGVSIESVSVLLGHSNTRQLH